MPRHIDACEAERPLAAPEVESLFNTEIQAEVGWKPLAAGKPYELLLLIYGVKRKSGVVFQKIAA